MPHFERRQGNYLITTDSGRFDVDAIHAYLVRSYWAKGIPKEIVARSIQGSLCFSLLSKDVAMTSWREQIGFARVISDRATFAYLCDVYVLEEHRGRGLAQWLIQSVIEHPDLGGLRRFVLATRDAHGLYERYGFTPLARPNIFMEIARPGLYEKTP
jgi:ribosomal protein S18 acetylase RimI-like enzyme